MIKCGNIKPIVIDNEKHLLNLNNWVMLSEQLVFELFYDSDDVDNQQGFTIYNMELEWEVDNQIIITTIEVHHTWQEEHDSGDHWNPPTSDIVVDNIEVYMIVIHNESLNIDYNIDYRFVMRDLSERLSYHIKDTYYTYFGNR